MLPRAAASAKGRRPGPRGGHHSVGPAPRERAPRFERRGLPGPAGRGGRPHLPQPPEPLHGPKGLAGARLRGSRDAGRKAHAGRGCGRDGQPAAGLAGAPARPVELPPRPRAPVRVRRLRGARAPRRRGRRALPRLGGLPGCRRDAGEAHRRAARGRRVGADPRPPREPRQGQGPARCGARAARREGARRLRAPSVADLPALARPRCAARGAVAERLGPDTEAIVRRDPYALVGAIPGVGFATADQVALELGFARDGLERCAACLSQALRAAASDGHTLLDEPRLFAAARELAGSDLPLERLRAALDELDRSAQVRRETLPGASAPAIYLPYLAASEMGLAASVTRLLAAPRPNPLADEARALRAERLTGIALDPGQRGALLGSLRENLVLLTGGPGVGKTTLVRLVVEIAEASGARVLLASPTGRAAKRLAEASGRPAATLHRALGFDPRS